MRTLILLSTLLPLLTNCVEADESYEASSERLDKLEKGDTTEKGDTDDKLGSRIAIQSFRRGTWSGTRTCYTNGDQTIAQNAWVDISVYSLGPEKTITMIWTDDAWETTHEADAWYEGSVGGNYERWGVDLEPVGVLDKRSFGIFWDRTHAPDELTTNVQFVLSTPIPGADCNSLSTIVSEAEEPEHDAL